MISSRHQGGSTVCCDPALAPASSRTAVTVSNSAVPISVAAPTKAVATAAPIHTRSSDPIPHTGLYGHSADRCRQLVDSVEKVRVSTRSNFFKAAVAFPGRGCGASSTLAAAMVNGGDDGWGCRSPVAVSHGGTAMGQAEVPGGTLPPPSHSAPLFFSLAVAAARSAGASSE
jgi:hypothetical protein